MKDEKSKRSEPPIACLLDGRRYAERMERIGALAEKALLSRDCAEGALQLRFRLASGVMDELETLVGLERECCPFLGFEIKKSSDAAILRITGPEEAAQFLEDFWRTRS